MQKRIQIVIDNIIEQAMLNLQKNTISEMTDAYTWTFLDVEIDVDNIIENSVSVELF